MFKVDGEDSTHVEADESGLLLLWTATGVALAKSTLRGECYGGADPSGSARREFVDGPESATAAPAVGRELVQRHAQCAWPRCQSGRVATSAGLQGPPGRPGRGWQPGGASARLRWLRPAAALPFLLSSVLTLPAAPTDGGCEPDCRLPEPVPRWTSNTQCLPVGEQLVHKASGCRVDRQGRGLHGAGWRGRARGTFGHAWAGGFQTHDAIQA